MMGLLSADKTLLPGTIRFLHGHGAMSTLSQFFKLDTTYPEFIHTHTQAATK